MKRFVFVFLFFLLIAACDSPMDNQVRELPTPAQKTNSLELNSLILTINTQWLVGPVGTINFNNSLLVSIHDQQGQLRDLPEDHQLQFYSSMPSMGHPMDDAGYFEKIATGLYLNSTIKYNMQGDWLNEIWLMDSNFQINEKVQWHESF